MADYPMAPDKIINILVVEDERIIARDIQMTLEESGYSVPEIAGSGEEAIDLVRSHAPDLVLMDIHLTGELDGIMAAEAIRKFSSIPIIYLTAHADEITLKRAKLTGPIGYILKPFEGRDLKTTIEIAIHKSQSEKALFQNSQWLNTILQSMGDGVLVTDQQGQITYLNPQGEVLLGCTFDQALGHPVHEVIQLFCQQPVCPVVDLFNQVLQTTATLSLEDCFLLQPNLSLKIPIRGNISPIYTAAGQLSGTVLVFQDMSHQRQLEEQLRFQALHDYLTGLPNRAALLDQLAREIERTQRWSGYGFALLFLDLDRFKAVNDSLGHAIGDDLLREISRRLLEQVRQVDLVARLGGDEFAILLTETTDLRQICQVAERLIAAITRPLQLQTHHLTVATSIGIVMSGANHLSEADLLQAADIAMYRAKRQGGNRYEVFNQSLGNQIKADLQLEQSLRLALNNHELRAFYQPILALPDQIIVGLEVLLRWQPATGPLQTPHSFIQVALDSNLIVAMDWWVLETACRQMVDWQQQGCAPNWISVNFSSRHFSCPGLAKFVADILERTQLGAEYLKLEITEDAIIKNPQQAQTMLKDLRALGVQLYLDDFGTGYSSLSHLHQFPVDGIKIDRSFIKQINHQANSLAIVRSILLLAESLGIDVVAEGVETAAHRDQLLALGCGLAQGTYYYWPMTALDWRQTHQLLTSQGD